MENGKRSKSAVEAEVAAKEAVTTKSSSSSSYSKSGSTSIAIRKTRGI